MKRTIGDYAVERLGIWVASVFLLLVVGCDATFIWDEVSCWVHPETGDVNRQVLPCEGVCLCTDFSGARAEICADTVQGGIATGRCELIPVQNGLQCVEEQRVEPCE